MANNILTSRPCLGGTAIKWGKTLWFLSLFCVGFLLSAAEVIPAKPQYYFTDEAHVVSASVGQQLEQKLTEFERQTSDQVVVAIYPKMQSDSSIDDFTQRTAQKWEVGQKDKKNGVVLFVFIQDRKMFIQVGYGLEGVLPDALAKRIVENEIKPHFKSGDYTGGVAAGVEAILQAIKGEYKGTGQTVAQGRSRGNSVPPFVFFFAVIFLFVVFSTVRRFMGGAAILLGGSGRSSYWSSGGGGGWGGGGSSGGGFSSGGGSFGGGGAGGSW